MLSDNLKTNDKRITMLYIFLLLGTKMNFFMLKQVSGTIIQMHFSEMSVAGGLDGLGGL